MFLYVASIILFLIFIGTHQILQHLYPRNDAVHIAIKAMQYVYFGQYSLIAIYCYLILRTLETTAYSSQTLLVYKRMAFVHFIQVNRLLLL